MKLLVRFSYLLALLQCSSLLAAVAASDSFALAPSQLFSEDSILRQTVAYNVKFGEYKEFTSTAGQGMLFQFPDSPEDTEVSCFLYCPNDNCAGTAISDNAVLSGFTTPTFDNTMTTSRTESLGFDGYLQFRGINSAPIDGDNDNTFFALVVTQFTTQYAMKCEAWYPKGCLTRLRDAVSGFLTSTSHHHSRRRGLRGLQVDAEATVDLKYDKKLDFSLEAGEQILIKLPAVKENTIVSCHMDCEDRTDQASLSDGYRLTAEFSRDEFATIDSGSQTTAQSCFFSLAARATAPPSTFARGDDSDSVDEDADFVRLSFVSVPANDFTVQCWAVDPYKHGCLDRLRSAVTNFFSP